MTTGFQAAGGAACRTQTHTITLSPRREHGDGAACVLMFLCLCTIHTQTHTRSLPHPGESMETALRECCQGIKLGKILVHRCVRCFTANPSAQMAKLPGECIH